MRSTTLFAACLVFSLGSVASLVNAQVNEQEICRTPGFWGTHAGEEKLGSINISEDVIRAWLSVDIPDPQMEMQKCEYNDGTVEGKEEGTVSCNFEPPGQAGSPKACRDAKKNDITLLNNFPSGLEGEGIDICGQIIVPVEPSDSNQIPPPVVEALCVSPSGDSRLQLGRQLTAAALNCVLSGGGGDCTGTSIKTVFDSCNSNSMCDPMAEEDKVNSCIEKLDCFNNGGMWNYDPQAMYCEMDVAESCHDQPLIDILIPDSEEPEEPPPPE